MANAVIRSVLKCRGASIADTASVTGLTSRKARSGSISVIAERIARTMCSGSSDERLVMYPLGGPLRFPGVPEPYRVAGCTFGVYHWSMLGTSRGIFLSATTPTTVAQGSHFPG